MKKLSSEVQDVTHEHSFSGAEGGYRCACGVIRPDRDDVPNAAFRRHGVQDVDRCVKCGHDAPLFDEPPLEGHCTVDIAVGNEKGGRPCGCKCEFPSTSVSEAAPKPERIWMHMEDGDCWCSYHFDPNDDRNLTEYARVHQPPEQNLEDKNSVSGASDFSTARTTKDISLTVAEIRERRVRYEELCYRSDLVSELKSDIDSLLSIIDTLQRGDGLELRAQVFADALTIHRLSEHDDEHGLIAIEKCPHPQCVRLLELSRHTQDIEPALRGHNPELSQDSPASPTLFRCAECGISYLTEVEARECHAPESPSESESTVDEAARLATREDAEQFIQQHLSAARWEGESLMISFEREALIHALVEEWTFELEATAPVQPEVSKEQDNAKS